MSKASATPKTAAIAALVAIAACSMSLSSGTEIQLLPAGSFRGFDGRPFDAPDWHVDGALAQTLVAAAAARLNPYVIDYEHQTLHAKDNGQPAPAAGWFHKLEWREGEGLFAVDVEWTAAASAMIDAKEYKFISPVIAYDKAGAVKGLLMAAITNNAAIHGMDEVMQAAASLQFAALTNTPPPQEPQMDELLEQIRWMLNLPVTSTPADILEQLNKCIDLIKQDTATAAATFDLGTMITAQRTQIAALTAATPDPAQFVPVATMSALQSQVAALSAELNTSRIDTVVKGALAAGKLVPAQEAWARDFGSKDIAALTSYIANAPALGILGGMQSGGSSAAAGLGVAALTDSQAKLCAAMGQDPKEFLATLKAEVEAAG